MEDLVTQQPKKSRRGLGRGLGALIQDTSETVQKTAEESTGEKTPSTPPSSREDRATKTEVGDRYLEDKKPSRAKRRPADLFFEDDPTPAGRTNSGRSSILYPILQRPSAQEEYEDETGSDALRELPVEDIQLNPRQPREEFDEEAMI